MALERGCAQNRLAKLSIQLDNWQFSRLRGRLSCLAVSLHVVLSFMAPGREVEDLAPYKQSSGPCLLACGCQRWEPQDEPSENSLLCDACEHHLCYHSLGEYVCKWQMVDAGPLGDPTQGCAPEAPKVLAVCRCSKWIGEGKKCECCKHHKTFHVAAPLVQRVELAQRQPSAIPPSNPSSLPPPHPQKQHTGAPGQTSKPTTIHSYEDDIPDDINSQWIPALFSKLHVTAL